MQDRVWTTIFFPTPLIFRYHLPLTLMKIYGMSLVWAGSISLDSTFKNLLILHFGNSSNKTATRFEDPKAAIWHWKYLQEAACDSVKTYRKPPVTS